MCSVVHKGRGAGWLSRRSNRARCLRSVILFFSFAQIDLVQIKQMFTQMYQKTLATMISSDTSGDYRRLLLSIVGQ